MQPPPRPDAGPARLGWTRAIATGTTVWIAIVVGGVGLLAIVSMHDQNGSAPPTSMFAAAGILMSVVGFVTVAIAARSVGTTMRAAIALGGGFAAIALAKFAMGPTALYQGNQHQEITTFATMDSTDLIFLIAGTILVLYIGAVWFLAAAFRPAVPPDGPSYKPVIACLAMAVVGTIGSATLVSTTAGDYLRFIMTGLEATGIAIALFVATSLVALAFRDTARRTRALGTHRCTSPWCGWRLPSC